MFFIFYNTYNHKKLPRSGFSSTTSCSKKDSDGGIGNNLIYGVWINAEPYNDMYKAVRASKFIENYNGFEIKSNGDFIERANSGWCGTPPISYSNYNGYWTEPKDSEYQIDVEYWGGRQVYTLVVIEVSESAIFYKLVY